MPIRFALFGMHWLLMNLQHLNIKIFVDGPLNVDWERFIEIFHRWTADQSMPEMMIDVADYRHVPNGPGVVLVGHEADYFMDNTDGQPGLRYNCKVARQEANQALLRQAFEHAATACVRLEAELPDLKFSRTRLLLSINDRAVAPNTDDMRAAGEQILPGLMQQVFGQRADITFDTDARKLFAASVVFSQPLELSASV